MKLYQVKNLCQDIKDQHIETEINKVYRIATLTTLYLEVSGIIMPSF